MLIEAEDEENIPVPLVNSSLKRKEDLKDIIINNEISEEMKKDLMEILEPHKDIFTDIPGTTLHDYQVIDFVDENRIRIIPYTLPYRTRREQKKEIEKMLKMAVIVKSTSPFLAPVVVLQKKDGTKRVCFGLLCP